MQSHTKVKLKKNKLTLGLGCYGCHLVGRTGTWVKDLWSAPTFYHSRATVFFPSLSRNSSFSSLCKKPNNGQQIKCPYSSYKIVCVRERAQSHTKLKLKKNILGLWSCGCHLIDQIGTWVKDRLAGGAGRMVAKGTRLCLRWR